MVQDQKNGLTVKSMLCIEVPYLIHQAKHFLCFDKTELPSMCRCPVPPGS